MSDANPVQPAASVATATPAPVAAPGAAPSVVAEVKADAAAVKAEPAKVEAVIVKDEAKASSWIVKHPDATVAILAAVIIALFVLGMHML